MKSFMRFGNSIGFIVRLFHDTTFLEWALIGVFVIHIISTSYLGVQGSQAWRQSDVYSQILGFQSFKGLSPLSNFFGNIVVYDIPIYQGLIAFIAKLLRVAPLVGVRIVNAAAFVLGSVAMYSVIRKFSAKSPVFYGILFAISPLFVHYYITPLPDLLSIGLSLFCISGAIAGISLDIGFLAAWIAAVLIKSPVPFVFLIFLLSLRVYLSIGKFRPTLISNQALIVYSSVGLIFALIAEKLRSVLMGNSTSAGFAQDPGWYFGTLQQRLSFDIYKNAFFRHFANDIDPSQLGSLIYPALLILILVLLSIAYSICTSRSVLIYYVPCVIAIVIPWLVFTNLYAIHNYYQLPGQVLLTGSASIGLSSSFEKITSFHFKYFSTTKKHLLFAIILILVVMLLPRMGFHSSLAVTSKWKGVESLFRNSNSPIHVYAASSQIRLRDPSIGGRTSSPIILNSTQEILELCRDLPAARLPDNGIAIKGDARVSQCADSIKKRSKSFIEEDQFYAWSN